MRHALAFALVSLAACEPAPSDADTDTDVVPADTDTDTDTSAPVVPPASPAVLSGRESYQERRCPLLEDGARLPKGAIVQAWACNGPTCWSVPELLSVERGSDEDVAIFDGCSGADRFELSWIAIVP